jgi:hypothetical protein
VRLNIQGLWQKPPVLVTNVGMVMLALGFSRLFYVPNWYNYVAGGMVVAGTLWWGYNQIKGG